MAPPQHTTTPISHTNSNKRVLVVLTSVTKLDASNPRMPNRTNPGDVETGFDLKEVAYIHEFMTNKNHKDIVYATIPGGEAIPDPRSIKEAEKDELASRLIKDNNFMNQFKNLISIENVNPEEFSWILFPGCRGAMYDFACHDKKTEKLMEVIRCIYEDNHGCIGAIGHGVAALINVKLSSSGSKQHQYLVKDKKITCFTNEEEEKLGFTEKLPFHLEEVLKEKGAVVKKAKPFEVNVVEEERLITAQNSMSAREWIMKITSNL